MKGKDAPVASRTKIWVRIGAAALLASLVTVGWWELRRTGRPSDAPVAARTHTLATAVTTVAAAASVPSNFDHAPTGSPADDSESVAICGLGRVKLDSTDEHAAFAYVGALSADANSRWRSALLNSDDPRARAIGLFEQTEKTSQSGQLLRALQPEPALQFPSLIPGDDACETAADATASSGCRHLSAQGLAQLDSDNASIWLLLAAKARATNDVHTERDAMDHAAQAHVVTHYGHSLLPNALPEIPADASPLVRAYLPVSLLGIEAGLLPYSIGQISRYCSIDGLKDPHVASTCSSLAELFAERGRTLIDFGVAIRLGERVGWNPRRLGELQRERDALMQLASNMVTSDRWDCDSVARANAYVGNVAHMGELAALRMELTNSGESSRELARRWNAYLDKMRADPQTRPPDLPASAPN